MMEIGRGQYAQRIISQGHVQTLCGQYAYNQPVVRLSVLTRRLRTDYRACAFGGVL